MSKLVWLGGIGMALWLATVARAAEKPSALALFQRLTGTNFALGDPREVEMQRLIDEGKLKEAARVALADPKFIDVKVRDLAAQYTNVDENPVVPFDDLQALFVGLARDDEDFRKVLTGDLRYEASKESGLTAPSLKANMHYAELEQKHLRPSKVLQPRAGQWGGDAPVAAGAFTTFSFAKAHYSAGTNRRAFKYAFQEFLCRKPEAWRDASVPDDFVRADVDRAPAKRPDTYQTDCRGCHAGMDAMDGAFAQFDFKDQTFTMLPVGSVVPKMNQNDHVFRYVEKTADSRWVNYLTNGHNEDIGWQGKTEGNGILEFAQMIANSNGFADCLAERVFRHTCRVKQPAKHLSRTLGEKFRERGYLLKELFAEAAIHPDCNPSPGTKNFREIYEHYQVATGVSESDALAATFATTRDKLPRYGFADEITPAMRQSLITLASKFCEEKVRRSLAESSDKRDWFKSFEPAEMQRTVETMARSFWGRLPNAGEKALLTSIADDFPPVTSNPESAAQIANAVCLVVASSFESLSLH